MVFRSRFFALAAGGPADICRTWRWVCVAYALFVLCAVAAERARAKGSQGGRRTFEDNLVNLLRPTVDPLSPHAKGFEPRTGAEDDDIWAFGPVHAIVHHVLEAAPLGDAVAVGDEFDAFSSQHGLGFGLDEMQGLSLDRMMQSFFAPFVGLGDPFFNEGIRPELGGFVADEKKQPHGASMSVIVLGSGVGDRELRLLRGLPPRNAGETKHEVVSVEPDADLASAASRLVAHALGDDQGVHHTPLIPSIESNLKDLLSVLHVSYGLPQFDMMLLDGENRLEIAGPPLRQLQTLLNASALREGTLVQVKMPQEDSKDASEYMEFVGARPPEPPTGASIPKSMPEAGEPGVAKSEGTNPNSSERLAAGGRHIFDSKVEKLEKGGATVVSTYRGRTEL